MTRCDPAQIRRVASRFGVNDEEENEKEAERLERDGVETETRRDVEETDGNRVESREKERKKERRVRGSREPKRSRGRGAMATPYSYCTLCASSVE